MTSPATLWRDNLPVSAQFDDPYYSTTDGLAESRHVFVEGNNLPRRWDRDLHIAELGFGTGLSFLTVWQAWTRATPKGQLTFTSFEAFPLEIDDQRRALRAFPELAPLSARLIEALEAGERDIAPGLRLNIVKGDARSTVPDWEGAADAWFLDGFSPAKNPQMWEPALLKAVFEHTKPGGSFATFTAAGEVRRSLARAGFVVERTAGFGRKRHMSAGRRP